MTRESGFKRRVRARMARTGEAYAVARRQLDRSGTDRSVLHVTNGDSAAAGLRLSGLGGPVLAWRDALHEGPVPGHLAPAELRRVRADHLARRVGQDVQPGEFADRDRTLEANAQGEYVLWFEADLYDQLQLVQVLDALARLEVEPERISLVSIGEHQGIAHFGGLGELTPEQLGRLGAQAVVLRPETLDLAAAAWRAFTAAVPDGLPALTGARSPELRFLGEAFARLVQEYPSRSDGLSRTERRALLAVAEAPASAGRAFRWVLDAEPRPFLGDVLCYAVMRDLAEAAHPLLEIEAGEMPFRDRGVSLTATGRSVLAGDRDHVGLNGIDRWIGGVHLAGDAVSWRYDDRLERLSPH
jgi:hypothetical protein